MNFDDLHDPRPPHPGPAALAAVSSRARQLRRRRTMLAIAGGVVALAAIIVPAALVVTGNDGDGDRIVPATVPDTTVAPPPAPTSLAPTSTSPQALPTSVVAIRADGDAVLIDPGGAETVLYDGADPRTPPAEGELTVVDSVVLTPDGRTFVSTCCEPVPGTWFEVVGGQPPAPENVSYGHALALSPDGQRIASVGASGITVTDLERNVLASADLSSATTYRQPEHVMWLDDVTLAVIELRQGDEGDGAWLYTTDAGLGAASTAAGVRLQDGVEFTPRLVGVGSDGSILLAASANEEPTSLLNAYDPLSLTLRPAADVTIPTPALDAWYRDGQLTWVDTDGAIHIGAAVVPGEFAWARAMG